MKNKMTDVRNLLIKTMEQLSDKDAMDEDGMTLEKAKAIAHLGQVIVNSAKVEVDFLAVITSKKNNFHSIGTGFIEIEQDQALIGKSED